MRNSYSSLVVSSLVVLACGTEHHSVATVVPQNTAATAGATATIPANTLSRGGAAGASGTALGGASSVSIVASGGAVLVTGGRSSTTGNASGGIGTLNSGGTAAVAQAGASVLPGTGGMAGAAQGGSSQPVSAGAGRATATRAGAPPSGAGAGAMAGGGSGGRVGMGGVGSSKGGATQAGSVGNPATAGAAAQAGSGTCGEEYTACGCGCCGGVDPRILCYYPAQGDTIAAIRAADERVKGSANCSMAGCAMPMRSVCCTERPADPSDVSSYSAGYASVATGNQIRIEKRTANDQCIVVTLYNFEPGSMYPYQLSLPSNWRVQSVASRPCQVSAEFDTGIGALGNIAFYPMAGACSLSMHGSVFLASGSGSTVETQRFDLDDIPIENAVSSVCQ